MTLIDQHKAYMHRDRTNDPSKNGDVLCESCECMGNLRCGHKYLDEHQMCTLNEVMVCPCCNVVFDSMNKREGN